MDKLNKRELLKHKQLLIFAKYGYWVTQSSLDEVFISDDENILQQINSLKALKELYPKLTKEVNQDLNVLLTNQNAIGIKKYNEQYATNMRNDTETQMVEVLHYLSILENAQLTDKQRQLLIDIVSGYSYSNKAKDQKFLLKKIEKAKEKKCMNDKRVFTSDELRKLFVGFYSKEDTYWNEYLDYNKKLECYTKSVTESKIRGDYLRQLSLQYSVFPLTLECEPSEKI